MTQSYRYLLTQSVILDCLCFSCLERIGTPIDSCWKCALVKAIKMFCKFCKGKCNDYHLNIPRLHQLKPLCILGWGQKPLDECPQIITHRSRDNTACGHQGVLRWYVYSQQFFCNFRSFCPHGWTPDYFLLDSLRIGPVTGKVIRNWFLRSHWQGAKCAPNLGP